MDGVDRTEGSSSGVQRVLQTTGLDDLLHFSHFGSYGSRSGADLIAIIRMFSCDYVVVAYRYKTEVGVARRGSWNRVIIHG